MLSVNSHALWKIVSLTLIIKTALDSYIEHTCTILTCRLSYYMSAFSTICAQINQHITNAQNTTVNTR